MGLSIGSPGEKPRTRQGKDKQRQIDERQMKILGNQVEKWGVTSLTTSKIYG